MMERLITEFEPKLDSLFSETKIEGFDIMGYITNIGKDFLVDLVSSKNHFTPEDLLNTDKYHCLKRFLKEVGLFKPFYNLANDCWEKRNAILKHPQ